ncbi:MAG: alpha amylase C-terminal domain-containing protein [Tepidisphaeraceae bacterium]
MPRPNYRIGVPRGGVWREVLNTDAASYWGSGQGNQGQVESSPLPFYHWPRSITLNLPPLAAVVLKPVE